MNLNRVFGLHFAVNLAFGLAFVAVPAQLVGVYGVALNPGSMLVARLFGVATLTIALLVWRLRSVPGDIALLMTAPFALAHALGFACFLLAMLERAVNPLGWTIVALYAFFALAYANYAFGERHIIGPAL
jgi:hypothetical protein